MTFTLAACAEMLFLDRPIAERVSLIHDLGFAVEIWDWTTKDLAALAATGARFTSMTGYVEGSLTDPAGVEALLASAERSVVASRALGTPNLNLHGTGLDGQGLPAAPVEPISGPMWLTAVDTLRRVAALGEQHMPDHRSEGRNASSPGDEQKMSLARMVWKLKRSHRAIHHHQCAFPQSFLRHSGDPGGVGLDEKLEKATRGRLLR